MDSVNFFLAFQAILFPGAFLFVQFRTETKYVRTKVLLWLHPFCFRDRVVDATRESIKNSILEPKQLEHHQGSPNTVDAPLSPSSRVAHGSPGLRRGRRDDPRGPRPQRAERRRQGPLRAHAPAPLRAGAGLLAGARRPQQVPSERDSEETSTDWLQFLQSSC